MESVNSLRSWPVIDATLRTAIFDGIYISFLFIGVLEDGPPLSKAPIDLTILTSIFVTIVIVYSIVNKGSIEISRRALISFVILTGLLAWLSVSVFWTSTFIGFWKVVKQTVGLSIAFGYPILVIGHDRNRIVRLLWMIVLFGIGLVLLHFSTEGVPTAVPNRIAIARPIGLAVIIIGVRAVTTRKLPAMGWFGLAFLLFIALLQNGSRAPAASAIIATALAGGAALHFRVSSFRTYMSGVIPISVVGIITIILVLINMDLQTWDTFRRLSIIFEGGGVSLQYRLDYWSWAIDSWTSSLVSFIIGQGTGSFAMNFVGPGQGVYPHNIFIEISHAGGAIGLLLFLSFIIVAVKGTAANSVIRQPDHIAIAGLTLYMFLNAQFSGDIYINKYLFTVIGLLIASNGSQIQRCDFERSDDINTSDR